MRRNFYKIASVITSVTIAVSAMTAPMVSIADQLPDIAQNNTASIGAGDYMDKNEGTISSNKGTLNNNIKGGVVHNEGGTVINNSSGSETESGGVINKGTDENHQGTVTDNSGYVYNGSYGVVVNNNDGGYIDNKAGGTVTNNKGSENSTKGGIVKNEGGTVENNSSGSNTKEGGVINSGTEEHKGTVTNNSGYVLNDSYGVVVNNNDGGYVENTGGTVNNNYSGSDTEKGGVINKGTDENHKGTVEENSGYVYNSTFGIVENNTAGGYVDNKAGGTVTANTDGGIVRNEGGTVNSNSSGSDTVSGGVINSGTDENNQGTVTDNSGYVLNNAFGVVVNNKAGGYVKNDGGLVNTNAGTVGMNTGTVTQNTGTVEDNTGTVTANAVKAIVSNNSKIVLNNDGTIEVNTGSININTGSVKASSGTVETNNTGGLVENLAGGIVDTNNGTVYNMGGTIRKNIGTEFFSVEISGGSNATQSGASYGSDYNSMNWLGTTGTTQSSTTITVKPESGFSIREFNIPTEYGGFVTASNNGDGSWTLVVKSGLNIKLSIPDATLTNYDVNVSSGGESSALPSGVITSYSANDDSDGEDPAKPYIIPGTGILNPVNQLTVTSVDYTGAVISVPVSGVLYAIDMLSAFNNFATNGVTTPGSDNIVGAGFVILNHVFDSAVNPTIDIPVSANVKSGKTYKVMFSDGTTLDVTCIYDGILYIPVTKTAEGLTYIIYDTYTNPSTAMMVAVSQNMTGQVIGNADLSTGVINPEIIAMAGLASQ